MYQVLAPLVLAVDQDGKTHHVYQGGVIDWLSDEQAAYFTAEGLVAKVGDTAADAGDGDSSTPGVAATKAELVAWIIDNAVHEDGSEYGESELNRLNKHELRDIIDAVT